MADDLDTKVLREPIKSNWKDFIPIYGSVHLVNRTSPQQRPLYQMSVLFGYQVPVITSAAMLVDYITKQF